MAEQLLKDYERLREDKVWKDLPDLEQACVLVKRTEISPTDDIEGLLQEFSGWTGWLRRQSAIGRTWRQEVECNNTNGLPLNGEWCGPENESAHLRSNDKGGWLLYRYREVSSNPNIVLEQSGEQHVCLKEKVTLLAEDRGGKLAYSVYWGGPDEKIGRLFARFTGFVPASD